MYHYYKHHWVLNRHEMKVVATCLFYFQNIHWSLTSPNRNIYPMSSLFFFFFLFPFSFSYYGGHPWSTIIYDKSGDVKLQKEQPIISYITSINHDFTFSHSTKTGFHVNFDVFQLPKCPWTIFLWLLYFYF